MALQIVTSGRDGIYWISTTHKSRDEQTQFSLWILQVRNISLLFNMQAAVDFALNSQPFLQTPSRKRKASLDDEHDKDPSWIPSDSKSKRKRPRTTHVPADPVPLPLQAPQPPLCAAPAHSGEVEIKLDNWEQWARFSSIDTEMVICKNGRFVVFQCCISVLSRIFCLGGKL